MSALLTVSQTPMISAMAENSAERLWRRDAARIAARINFARWLELFNLFLVVALMVFSVVLLILRSTGKEPLHALGPIVALTGVVVLAAAVAWLRCRNQWIGAGTALVRIEDRLKLDNRLSAADAGVIEWPQHQLANVEELGLRWRWQTAWLPGVFSLAMVAAAWLVPLAASEEEGTITLREPDAWRQIETWSETLKEESLIAPESLEEMIEKVEELRNQPSDEWYDHASLEATDTLKEGLGRDIQELARDLGVIERDLEALRTFSTELSEAGRDMILQEMENAMESLAMNGLELNSELAEQLSEVDPSKVGKEMMKNLSPDQLKSLQEQLCSQCNSLGSLEGLPELSELEEDMGFAAGMLMNSGGVSQGQKDAPLFYGDEENLGTRNIQEVSNDDLSRAALGDLLGVGETEHEIDETPVAAVSGGEAASKGKGGDAVWRESLVPKEQALLKRYFK